ncbi:MAG: hypothetical protein ACRCYU_19130 [Nocardioides sp.]
MRRRIGSSGVGGGRSGRLRSARLVALIAVLVLGLVGCSDDPSESAAGWPTPTPRPTPPSPTPDPIRDIRQVKTAEEFIRLWRTASTEATNTGDTKVYRAITRDCVPCQAFAKDLELFYAKGGYAKTGKSRIDSIKRDGSTSLGSVFKVWETAPPTKYKESKTGPVKRLSGGKIGTEVTVIQEQFAGWLIVDALKLPVQP